MQMLLCLLKLSEDVQTLSVSHVISGNDIERFIDGLYFTDDIVVTDRTLIDVNSGEVKIIKVLKKTMQEIHLDIA